ncbi:MAG TPA: FAD/NAD(P)-binding protein [Rhizomicrobium sp.]|nr:FAD/NAD(P)-binding protein [Rhizomicrobium sp.]
MTRKSDRDLGMGRDIARRDFLQGVAIGVTFGALAPELAQAAEQEAQNAPGYYPPTRLGMRGDHPGSFEAAHELRDGDFWNRTASLVDDNDAYDLVVAGGGISGLSAAWFYRAANPRAKILIIENHDDFGGHAKRNEFHVNGRMELINGGTLGIDSPYPYSAVASGLLHALGVEPAKLSRECNVESVYAGMGRAVFFDRETFGQDRLVQLDAREWGKTDPRVWPEFLDKAPLTPAVKKSILKIQTGKDDYLPGLSGDEKKDRLSRISYKDYFLQIVKADPGVVPFYQHITDEWWGVGFDAISALDSWAMGYPGFDGLKLKAGGPSLKRMGYTPAGYSTAGGSEDFHFPDGNASIARLLVRALVPGSIPGKDAHDVVSAKADYAMLDAPGNAVRIRLNNIVVRARDTGKGVEVAYTASRGGGPVRRVRAKVCVLAGFNAMIPYIVPELPEPQKKALHALVRCPLVYTNLALRNWASFHTLGVRRIEAPGSYHMSVSLNPAVDIGSYRSVRNPDEPNLIRMVRAPAKPGLSEYDQNRFGRMELLQTPFETFERNIRDQLARTLAGTGFDPARDIEGIAVNRWAHGYAPEYNSLWDTDYDAQHGPNMMARRPFGRIAIANSDSGFAAYTDSAIDQAHRAVADLMKG